MSATVRAQALVGFYRGDLVQPGDVLELGRREFEELRAFGKVAPAPPPEDKPPAAARKRASE